MLNEYEKSLIAAGFSEEVRTELEKKVGKDGLQIFAVSVAREIDMAPWNFIGADEETLRELMDRMGTDTVDAYLAKPEWWNQVLVSHGKVTQVTLSEH